MPPAPINLRFWCPKVARFGQIVLFRTDYDEIKIKKIGYDVIFSDVIVITSPKNVIKITLQNFSILSPSNQNFWLRQ